MSRPLYSFQVLNRAVHVLMLTISALILMGVSSCTISSEISDQTKESLAKIEKSTTWFIEEGMAEYYRDKDDDAIDERIKEIGGFVPTDPAVMFDHSGAIVTVLVDSYWMGGAVDLYARVESDFVYEYWTLTITSSRSEPATGMYFIITKSDGIDKKREIIKRTETFFPEYTAPDGTVIRYPMHKRYAFGNLRNWKFPNSFKGTMLEGVKWNSRKKKYFKNGVVWIPPFEKETGTNSDGHKAK